MPATPGWYPDPHGRGVRYWDGTTWTEHAPQAPLPQAAPRVPTGTSPAAVAEGNTKAVASLILGIVAAVAGVTPVLFFFGWVLGIPAIVFGALGRRHANRRPGAGRKVMATWGLALGLVGVVAGVIWVVIAETYVSTGGYYG